METRSHVKLRPRPVRTPLVDLDDPRTTDLDDDSGTCVIDGEVHVWVFTADQRRRITSGTHLGKCINDQGEAVL